MRLWRELLRDLNSNTNTKYVNVIIENMILDNYFLPSIVIDIKKFYLTHKIFK